MPKIGLQKPKYSIITVGTDSDGNETETYGEIKTFAKAVTANTSINTSKLKFYADDTVSEMINEFLNGTITMAVDDIENTVLGDITGATVGEDGTVTMKDNDTAKYLRLGFIVRRYKNNKSEYRAVIFAKVMFDIPADDYETKGESIVFKSETVTGEIMRNYNHDWKLMSPWDESEKTALTWLDTNLKPSAVT